MPPAIAAFFSKWGVHIAVGLAVLVIVGILLARAYTAGSDHQVVKQQQQTIETQKKVGAANEKAAGERVAGEVKLEQQKKELEDAAAVHESPDDARRRRGCILLRQQGTDLARVPACRGFEGGPGAGVPAGSPAPR